MTETITSIKFPVIDMEVSVGDSLKSKVGTLITVKKLVNTGIEYTLRGGSQANFITYEEFLGWCLDSNVEKVGGENYIPYEDREM